jgi:hydroxymethylbilane synthase
MHIKIGTRGSKLALWQAHYVQELLSGKGIESEIIIIDTKGDKILNVTLSKIGSKGVFTEELEDQLLSRKIDIAVHSAKDLQSHLKPELELIAFTEREEANDVVVSLDPKFDLHDQSKKLVVGTSSTRRVALLKHFYPHVGIVDMRGNLQTRFEKLKNGACDAMLLAYAGVHRMNYDSFIVQKLSLEEFTPPVGQGSVAIECAVALAGDKKKAVRDTINHADTEVCLIAERAFLKKMNGGCSVPTFALCKLINENELALKGGIISLDGKEIITQFLTANKANPEKSGATLGDNVLKEGGDKILAGIKRKMGN